MDPSLVISLTPNVNWSLESTIALAMMKVILLFKSDLKQSL